jgi:hypothetical protein
MARSADISPRYGAVVLSGDESDQPIVCDVREVEPSSLYCVEAVETKDYDILVFGRHTGDHFDQAAVDQIANW